MTSLLHTEKKPDCSECGKFFSHPTFDDKCSRCYGYKGIASAPYPWYSQEFQRQLTEYVEEHTIDVISHYYQVIMYHTEKNNLKIVLEIFKEMRKENLWIKADFAVKLLRNVGLDIPEKQSLYCCMILDWWNMKREDGFNGGELCYYGNYGEGGARIVTTIPPKAPLAWNLKDVPKLWARNSKHSF